MPHVLARVEDDPKLKGIESVQRATELGVSLVLGDESDGAIDTRTLRSKDGFVDPLLQRLKDKHGK